MCVSLHLSHWMGEAKWLITVIQHRYKNTSRRNTVDNFVVYSFMSNITAIKKNKKAFFSDFIENRSLLKMCSMKYIDVLLIDRKINK